MSPGPTPDPLADEDAANLLDHPSQPTTSRTWSASPILRLGTLVNRVTRSETASAWELGPRALIRHLHERGLNRTGFGGVA